MKIALRGWFTCVAFLLLPVVGSAAVSAYIKLDGVDGGTKIVPCVDGVAVIDGLAAGSYAVQVCDAAGKVIPSDVTLECSITAPRDKSSGQATGKRQHRPIKITPEAVAKPARQLVVPEAGAQVTVKFPQGGAAPGRAQDHNSTRSNKTSN
jgi:hypothetical protein